MESLQAECGARGRGCHDPTIAAAQICSGYPSRVGALSVGGNFAKLGGGTSLGVEANYNYDSPFGAFARFNLYRPSGDDANASIIGAGLAYDVGGFVPIVPVWLSVCPVAAVSLESHDGTSTFAIPLGPGFGTAIPVVAGAIDLLPYAVPQFVFTRISVDDVSVSDHNFGIEFGALARFADTFYAGLTANRSFVEAAEIDLAVRAGIRIPL